MSEPNIPLLREGDTVMVRATIVDAHWRDKGLYKIKFTKIRLPMQLETETEAWVHDRYLRETGATVTRAALAQPSPTTEEEK